MVRELKKYPMYYGNVMQTYPNIKPGTSFYSKSVVLGNLVLTSGLDSRNIKSGKVTSDKFEEQMISCLDNIRIALEETGSSLDNLVKNCILLKNYKDAPLMWKVMLEYYQKYAPGLIDEPPVVTVTQVEALVKPECLVEIQATAVISKNAPGWEMRKYPMIYGGIKQVYPNVVSGQPFLSESVVVGNLVFLSGMAGEEPGTGNIETDIFEEQWKTSLNKVKSAMDNAGSSLSNVIKTLHFQCRLEVLMEAGVDLAKSHSPASDRLWKTELEYYDLYAPHLMDEPPGSTFLKVSSLADSKAQGQTEVVGVLSRYMKGWEVKKYPTYLGQKGFPRHIGEIKKYYANTVKVGNIVLVSGQTPTDVYTTRIESNVFEEQLMVALGNLKAALEETGSSLDNLVSTYILLPNPENTSSMRKLELEYYQKYAPVLVNEPPASTIIHPLNLASPAIQIEIDAIGFIPDN